MIANTDIERGAITATKLSKNLRLPLTNITAGSSGQVLVGQSNGDPAYKTVAGAVTIDSNGLTEMSATTDSVSEGTTNLYYTDERVDARIRAIRNQSDQLATAKEPGFMPSQDKVKLDATPSGSSAIKKFNVTFSWGTEKAGVSYPDGFDGTKATITHPLDSESVICSVTDVDGTFVDENTQLDMNFEDHVVVTVDSPNEVTLTFNPASTLAFGETYLITIIG